MLALLHHVHNRACDSLVQQKYYGICRVHRDQRRKGLLYQSQAKSSSFTADYILNRLLSQSRMPFYVPWEFLESNGLQEDRVN